MPRAGLVHPAEGPCKWQRLFGRRDAGFLLGSALAGSAGLAVGARGLWGTPPSSAAAAHAGHSRRAAQGR